MKVESVDVAQLDVVTELPDLRRDLHLDSGERILG